MSFFFCSFSNKTEIIIVPEADIFIDNALTYILLKNNHEIFKNSLVPIHPGVGESGYVRGQSFFDRADTI